MPEEALSQERYLLHALLDNIPDKIYFKDAASRFLRINKSLADFFGLADPAQAMGKTDFDFFTEEHARPAHEDEQEIIRTGRPVIGKEEKGVHQDGRMGWVSTTKMPLRNRDGAVIGTFGVSRDITKLKLAEEALRESEQRWRSLTEALPQLVWSATPDGACEYVSTQWTEHTGVAEADLLGWGWQETLHPEDREPTRQLWLESVAGRHPYDVEYRVRRRDGEYRWFKTRGTPIRDGGGNIVKWFGTCTDITDLRQTEDALRESEERFRGTFENAAVGIAHTDLDGRWLRVNEKLCAILGYPVEEALRLCWQDVTYAEDVPASVEQFAAFLQGQRCSYSLEKRYVRKDGSVIWGQLAVSLQRDAAGKPAYIIAVIQDISERKRLDAELRQAKEAAEAANRAKDEFLANVSHEIRTPMNAIMGMTELVLDTPLTHDQRQCLRTVKSAADNLLGIINALLDFAKIEAGKMELDPADFSLRAAVGDTLRALAVRAHTKGLELIYHVQPDAPDALVGDAGRLRQVLLNLVGNAIKFTERGEVVVEVERETTEDTEDTEIRQKEDSFSVSSVSSVVCLHFTVRDTGIGIPKEKRESIFRAFEQEDASTTRKYGGTGLGLTIASRLAILMGGEITVDSEPGRGSTFSFTARFGLQPHPPEQPAGRPPVLLHGLRVLIVDDNATNRRILEEWARGWRMEAEAVGDGVATLDALWDAVSAGRPYALVLLDARMPDADGLALAAKIRKRAELSSTRIILLTSGDRPGDLARSRERRVDAHLLKPVQQDELLETIYRVMSRGNERAASGRREPAGEAHQPAHASRSPLRSPGGRGQRIQRAAPGATARAAGLPRMVGQQRPRGAAPCGRGGLRPAAAGHPHAGAGRLPGRPGDPRARADGRGAPADHRPDGPLAERGPRPLPRGRDGRLPGQADPGRRPLGGAGPGRGGTRPETVPSPAGGETEPGLLDARVLLAACAGEAAILEGICRAFRSGLPDQLRAVQDALRDRDAPRLREAAHKLAGMVSAFSTAAGGVASDLEDHAAGGRLEEAGPLASRLEKMAEELLREADGLSLETLRRQAGPDEPSS